MNPISTESRQQSRAAHTGAAPVLPPPQVAWLSNDQYRVRFSGVGSGYSEFGGIAISRAAADETRDADGFHIYLRDLDDNFVWSTGYQPTRVKASQYEFRCERNRAEIVRRDRGIDSQLTVCVSPQLDFEVRRCQLTNVGDRPRRIELTSYLEWVLACREADANHPAFSKLFIETQFCAKERAILARRRPRSCEETEIWGFHSIVCEAADGCGDVLEFETNRVRFIGRGRTLARPQALDAGTALSGDYGPVLDPIASLRVAVALEPGESRQIAFTLGAARSRSHIEELLAAIGDWSQVERVLDEAMATADSTIDGKRRLQDGAASGLGQRVIVHPPHRAPGSQVAEVQINGQNTAAALVTVDGKPRATGNRELLEFDNGCGGFSADGREYVILLQPDGRGGHHRPPMPWTNVIANPQAGFLVTESGAGYTWAGNSRVNRLTAWHNDPVCDPHGEAFWIRDDDAGVFWSPTPGPTPATTEYRVRHGFGYTTFEHESHELSQQLTMFMDREQPVKLTRLRLVNRSRRARRLSLFSYVHWALGGLASETASTITTECDADQRVVLATNPDRERYGACVAFSALRGVDAPGGTNVSCSCDRMSFLGRYGDADAPAAVVSGNELDGCAGSGLDPCAAWQASIELAPGDELECTFLLGEAVDRESATLLIDKYRDAQQVECALADVTESWRQTLSALTIETPCREIDLLVNGWLLYQNMSCRMWGRSAYYQPGGAFGFRDQLQDAAALVHHRPDITRAQVLRHAGQQFVEGDVLHWWHPDTGYGLRTRFSDDLLWLPFVAAEYVQSTGDEALLDEQAPFISAAPLAAGQQEAYLRPEPAGEVASVYEHCCRALDRGLTTGAHGLPLIGCGDWNDGFSRVGRQGQGESVWLGFFIDYVLQRMLPICARRGDDQRVAHFTVYRERLAEALNSAGWDGGWYRRAYYDNGQPLGSAGGDECQIDALAQAWAVISNAAPADRADLALRAVEERLICDEHGMIRLLAPPFNRTPNDPGYIKGYLRGIRENGGQYTHGVLWVVRAMAEIGRGTRAVELLRMLTPVWHTSSAERVGVYQTEPYAVAADVYGEPPHVGRGGWTWYTGSAGWMFRVAVESILGLSTERGDTLVMNPSISSDWPQCRLTYRLPDGSTRYEILIENPSGKERGVTAATLDGQPAAVQDGAARVPLVRDGRTHHVVVRL